MNEPEIRWKIYRATFDTTIFVRLLIRKRNDSNCLLSLWQEGRFVLVLSQSIIDEVERVLSRPKMLRNHPYTLTEVTNLVNLLHQANIGDIPSAFELCRDPNDDMFVDCAISGRVQFLVSYDKDFIDDTKFKQALFEFGVVVLDPPNFLQEVRETEINISDFN